MTLSVKIRQTFEDFALNIDFEAPDGLTALFGASGSGKTTVVNAVAGLSRPDEAKISVGARVLSDTQSRVWVPPHRREIGYIFQEGRLFPHMSVRKNLLYGRALARDRSDEITLDRVVEMLGLGDLLVRRSAYLSGGEKQRVAIGRALLARPNMILADEPLAALDEARKAEIMPYFELLRDEFSVPILYVSHSIAEVARLATTVVALEKGKVSRVGSAGAVLSDPEFTPAGVRAVGAVLEAKVREHHRDGLTELDAGGTALFLPKLAHKVGRTVRVRIAAHDVILSRDAPKGLSALNILSGKIAAVRAGDGPGAIVSIDTNAGRVLARVTRRSVQTMGLAEGQAIHAVVKSVAVAPEDVGR
ncbi:Sulfate/thiosulfate import ATP-binding protein CysA [Shimia sp. SK013]|uniref:molybdenum ABC transporter ATP-binding protein n=1 Tax=Shimia sp. SK013 TaxID=1389006 RepID=UPI0006B6322C|nr:molybdenum ABC transporter ATP-binding protein [Shimia sp. SK013]KPA20622.1 Sulfate/thiosulfate import ATP-binding protein CysA [Shimia sp. SK013]